MALRMGKLNYRFNPIALTPHNYEGVFWNTVAQTWLVLGFPALVLLTAGDIQANFEAIAPAFDFEWNIAAPPV